MAWQQVGRKTSLSPLVIKTIKGRAKKCDNKQYIREQRRDYGS